MDTITKGVTSLISPAALRQAMTVRGLFNDDGELSPQALADLTEAKYGKGKDKPGRLRPVGRQIISHLINGHRTTTSANTAAVLEGALDVPAGSLFRFKPYSVPEDTTQRRTAA